MTRIGNFLILFILLLTYSNSLKSEEDEWEDDWSDEPAYQLSHELWYGYSYLLEGSSVNIDNAVLNEFRSKSKLDYQTDFFSLNLDIELYADVLTDEYQANFYEFNVLMPLNETTDLKIGRQVITWGTGDLLFLNDLFSKDWKSFFNGRDDSYLKPPVDALRLSHYGDSVNFEIALLAEFEADQTLTGERYSFFIPGAGIIQPQPELVIQNRNNPEISARLFKNYKGQEWAIYAYNGYFKSPNQIDLSGNLGFSKMNALGASLRMPLAGGLFNTEWVYYNSRDDQSGNNAFIQNSQSRFLIGYEKEIAKELTLGTQVFLDKTLDYQALVDNLLPQQIKPEQNRTLFSLRLTHQALQQRLLNSFMLFYSPSDKDHYLRYSSRYSINDQWKIIAGLNILHGNKEQTFFAQMQDNSNLFFRVQYSFDS